MTSLFISPTDGTTPHAYTCAHCGLAVPRGLIDQARSEQFCCAGCEAVHHAIRSHGLDAFYAIQDRSEAERTPAQTTSRRFDELDDDEFRTEHCQVGSDGLSRTQLALEGMHCPACVWLLEKLPAVTRGVAEVRADLGRRTVQLRWDDGMIPLSRIARRLASFGYVPHAVSSRATETIRRTEDRRYLVRIAVAGALAGNVMLMAFALYGGMLHGIEAPYARLFRWTSMGLALVSLAWPGRVFFRGAWSALRTRTAHMDVPIAVGLSAGALWSIAATVRGVGEVYFDSITVLVFLLLVGRWIQVRQQRRSSDALELLYSMTPRHARLLTAEGAREVSIASLQPGQRIEVRAGETIPVDGSVAGGQSQVDTSWLTGEARPVPIGAGDLVHAGGVNLASSIEVEVQATGHATRAGRLMQLVEACAAQKAPVVKLADRIAGVFVAVVLSLAMLTMLAWWRVDPSQAVEHAIALLIITCPCALGLATPLALVAAIGRAARRGMLIKGGETIEALAGPPGVVFLDKTGTITEGRVQVSEWHGEESLQPLLAALEAGSAHPVAEAITRAFTDHDTGHLHVENVHALSNGMTGTVAGRCMIAGSRGCMEACGVPVPEWAEQCAQAMAARARSPVFVAIDGRVQALAGVGDTVRADARDSIAALRRAGWRVSILSGDHERIVREVGAEVGLDEPDCVGGMTPEEKLRAVEGARESGAVVMVGDGVNDAAALAAATVGVAVHGGAEASITSADVYLNRDGLAAVPELIAGSTRAMGVVRRGLLVSLLYNVLGSGLAMAGMIDPIVAAVLMPASSLTVVMLAYRARTFGGPRCQ